jgi:hypothetical protein
MTDPRASITVLGVYRVPVDEKELREQLRRFYFFGNAVTDANNAVYKFLETCVPLVLFEVILDNLDEQFQNGRLHSGDARRTAEGRAVRV